MKEFVPDRRYNKCLRCKEWTIDGRLIVDTWGMRHPKNFCLGCAQLPDREIEQYIIDLIDGDILKT